MWNLGFLFLGLFALVYAARPFLTRLLFGPKYICRPLMTSNEVEFFHRLQRALPDLHIFPQVAMSALITPVKTYEEDKRAYWNISKKIVDFAIFNKQMQLICLVELDDIMHDVKRDAVRDSYTASAGVTTIRWQSREKPSERDIRMAVLQIRDAASQPKAA